MNDLGFSHFSQYLYVPHTLPDRLYFYFIFSFEYFDSFDHYAAFYVPLKETRKGKMKIINMVKTLKVRQHRSMGY